MKKVILAILVILSTINCFAISSPSSDTLIQTNPVIPFDLIAADEIEEGFALEPIYAWFGTRLADTFHIWEAITVEVQPDWEIIKFRFLEDFTQEDTIFAVFDNDETDYIIFALDVEDYWVSIDFSTIPLGFNRIYIVSDYEG